MNKIQSIADDIGLGEYFQKVRFFSDLIFMFWGLGFTMNKIYESEDIHNMIRNILSKFDSNYVLEVTGNIHEDWGTVAVLLMTLPGKSCESIGTRLGIVLRKVTGVSIEGFKHAQNFARIINDSTNKNN